MADAGTRLASFEFARPLAPALLYRRCAPEELPFALCSELEAAPSLIGQERAVDAIRFAMRMRRKGYNIYALGVSGTGRRTLVDDLLRLQAEAEPTPPDWCYVNNFADPQRPHCLRLPAGRAAGFAAAMKRLVEELRAALPAAFERDEFRTRREALDQQLKQKSERAFGVLQEHAAAKDVSLRRSATGLALAPVHEGRVVPTEEFESLPESERNALRREIEAIQGELEAVMRQVPLWEREHRNAVRALNRVTAGFEIAHLMQEVRAAHADLPDVVGYLDAVAVDVVENTDDFLTPAAPAEGPAPVTAVVEDARFRRYGVNLFVDNGGQRGAAIVYEDNPTHQSLVGRVEHLARFGALITDFNLLMPGHCTGPMAVT